MLSFTSFPTLALLYHSCVRVSALSIGRRSESMCDAVGGPGFNAGPEVDPNPVLDGPTSGAAGSKLNLQSACSPVAYPRGRQCIR